jgi:tetratricopeptide (TPR) repeat protein
MAQQKYAEAIVEYRNAVAQDGSDGMVRLKLGDAFAKAGNYAGALSEYVRAADLMPDHVGAQLAAGRGLLLAGQFPEAKARAVAALAKEPKNVDALLLLGNAMAGLKDFDAAISQIEDAIEADPRQTLSYANLGVVEFKKGDPAAAEGAFKRAVEIDPSSEAAHLNLANYYWSGNQLPQAERELKLALGVAPKSLDTNRALASFYVTSNRPKEAEQYLKTYADLTSDVGPKLVLADFYLSHGKTEEGIAVLRALVDVKEGFAPAKLRLAAIDFAKDRRPQAYEELEEVFKRDPKNETAFLEKARFLLLDGKASEALAQTDAAVAANPTSVAGHYWRGAALEASGQKDAAVEAFQRVLQLKPTTAGAQLKLAELFLDRGDAAGAAEFAGQAVKAQPRSIAAHLVWARSLVRLGNTSAAEKEVMLLAKSGPNIAEVHAVLGDFYWAKGDLARARESYTRALQLRDTSVDALAGLVRVDVAQKRPDLARARIEERLAKMPNDGTLLMLAGATFLTIGDSPRAEAAYRHVIEVDPSNIEAYSRLAGLLKAQQRLDEAKKEYLEIAKRRPKAEVAATTMVGIILTLQGKHAEARKEYERALSLDNKAAVAANNLAWYYSEDGSNLDQALNLAQIAKAGLPKNAETSDTLGWVYYKKGLASLAVSSFREGISQSPSNPVIHYHLGLAYLKNGNAQEAQQSLQRALKLSPGFEGADDARQVLASIKS